MLPFEEELAQQAPLPVIPKGPLQSQPSHPITSDRNSDWLNVMYPIYMPIFEKTGGRYVCDQKKRAKLLAKMLLPQHKVIRLMDGYGRFTMLLMEAIRSKHGEKRLDSIKFEVVEWDDEVQAYHKQFFNQACNVKCIQSNIFDLKMKGSVLLYLNFCGIAESFGRLCRYLNCLSEQLLSSVLISYSKIRRAKSAHYKGRLNKQLKVEGRFVHCTDRVDFVTIRYDPKGAKSVHHEGSLTRELQRKDDETKVRLCRRPCRSPTMVPRWPEKIESLMPSSSSPDSSVQLQATAV